MFSNFVDNLYATVAKFQFDHLVWLVWGSYLAIFIVALLITLFMPKKRTVSKRPFLCLTNAYAAVNLALYLLKCELAQSILITALFWVIGYILYGALCALSRPTKKSQPMPVASVIASLPAAATAAAPSPEPVTAKPAKAEGTSVKNNVRLEHAVSVTNKLLGKNLGKTDRQELEKLKNTFAVLQIKGTLSPAESEILNDNFNTLLKLMAKYNV